MKPENEPPKPSDEPEPAKADLKLTDEEWASVCKEAKRWLSLEPPMPVPQTEDEITLSKMA